MTWELVGPTGQAYRLRDGAMIGRMPGIDISVNDERASRQHAEFRVRGDSITVRDLESTNGTYVNHARLAGSQTLRDGDRLKVGDTTFRVIWAREADSHRDRYSAEPAGRYERAAPQPERYERSEPRDRYDADRPRKPLAHADDEEREMVCPSCGRARAVTRADQAGLAGPEKPTDTWVKVTSIWFWAVVAIAGLSLLLVLGSGLAGGAITNAMPYSFGLGGLVAAVGVGGACLYLPFAAIALALPYFIRRHLKGKYREKLDAWEAANATWTRLRYCADCAGVFLPEQRRLIPVEQLQSFLFGLSSR